MKCLSTLKTNLINLLLFFLDFINFLTKSKDYANLLFFTSLSNIFERDYVVGDMKF